MTAVRLLATAFLAAACVILVPPTLVYAGASTPVSCDVISQDIRTVLKDLAAQAEVNVAIDDTVQKRITIRLKDVRFEDALRILASSAGFEVKEDAGVFLILPIAAGSSYLSPGIRPGVPLEAPSSFVLETGSLDPELLCSVVKTLGTSLVPTAFPDLGIVVVTGPYSEINSARAAIVPWVSKVSQGADDQTVRVLSLDYLDAQEALSSFSIQFPGVRTVVIRAANAVLLSGKEADVEKAAQAIRALDIPPRVVRIEVEVVEVVQDDLSRLGVGWKGSLGEPGFTISWKEAEPQSTSGSGGGSIGQIELRPWIRASLSLVTDINLLVEKGRARVLARPSVATVENKQARIMTGDRYILVLTQGQGQSTQQIQYIDAGVRLEIIPKVNSQGEITAQIYPQVSAITGFTKEGYPRISAREAQTTVRVKDGETIAIGGLMESREIRRTYGLPVLSEIPILGKLFSSAKDSTETTELVILVTLGVVEGGTDPVHKGGVEPVQRQDNGRVDR